MGEYVVSGAASVAQLLVLLAVSGCVLLLLV
jgi:hypothetical protein